MITKMKSLLIVTLYRYKVPWDINLAYSLTYVNSRNQNDFGTNSLMISSNITLTPKWRIGASSGYDFKQKGFTYTSLRFDRDLDSWRLNFDWVPFSAIELHGISSLELNLVY